MDETLGWNSRVCGGIRIIGYVGINKRITDCRSVVGR
jgi:hypothetical protein